jgi:hypothetical protein
MPIADSRFEETPKNGQIPKKRDKRTFSTKMALNAKATISPKLII